MFPDSDALLPCHHHSNAGSVWLFNIAQEAQSGLMSKWMSGALLQALLKTEQFWADTKSFDIVTWMY
jgi:hypothetical protein